MPNYNTRGCKYPLEISNGSFKLVDGPDLALTHIVHTLETIQEQRLLKPEFGIPDYIFNDLRGSVALGIQNQLETQIDSCTFNVTAQLGDEGILFITVEWDYLDEPQDPLTFEIQP